MTVTATNSGGSASVGFRVTVAAALPAPVAVGTLPAVVWPLGAGARTVSTQAGFAGEGLGYALEAAPAGATIDAGTGLVTIPTGTALEAATVTVRATNAAGSAVQSFAVTVRLVATVFDAAAALAEMSFVAEGAAPAWSLDAGGFARLVTASEGATHGLWSRSAGDGRYRALVRWSAPAAVDRPFSLSARLARSGSDFRGLRLDALAVNGTTRLDLRQYAGAGAASAVLAAAVAVAWTNDVWTWVELELDGATVRARLYPETSPAPDWQLTATTSHLVAGAAGDRRLRALRPAAADRRPADRVPAAGRRRSRRPRTPANGSSSSAWSGRHEIHGHLRAARRPGGGRGGGMDGRRRRAATRAGGPAFGFPTGAGGSPVTIPPGRRRPTGARRGASAISASATAWPRAVPGRPFRPTARRSTSSP